MKEKKKETMKNSEKLRNPQENHKKKKKRKITTLNTSKLRSFTGLLGIRKTGRELQ